MSKFRSFKINNSLKKYLLGRAHLGWILLSLFSLQSCIDPYPPEFEYIEGIYVIDGLASTVEGTTYITVRKTYLEYDKYKASFVSGCKVFLKNTLTNEEVKLVEKGENYLPQETFKVVPGSSWKVEVYTPDGKLFVSDAEITPNPVKINQIEEIYNTQMIFDEGVNKYIPGHEIRISFDDPQQDQNFYYYQYRAYQKAQYCKICFDNVLRNGKCVNFTPVRFRTRSYYTYACQTPCWDITYNEDVTVFNDEFTNGKTIDNLLVAKVPLYSKQKVLVEVLQLNITKEAYSYLKTLKDIVDNNSGFNAPLPSALIGNFYNNQNSDEPVLGRFTVASASYSSINISREKIAETAVDYFKSPQPEEYGDPLPPPLTYDAPCEENRNQTAIPPSEWILD